MSWFKDFFTNLFGSFWGRIADLFTMFLIGPLAYYLFGPLYRLSGMMVERLLSMLRPALGEVGVTFEGVGAWFVEVLRLQETVSMLLTFVVLGLTINVLKKVF